MKTNIYVVWSRLADCYGKDPLFARTDDQILAYLPKALSQLEGFESLDDWSVSRVGTYDNETGIVTGHDPVLLPWKKKVNVENKSTLISEKEFIERTDDLR